MAEDIVIEPATPADAEAAAEITREAFNGVSIDQAIEKALGPAGGRSWQDIKADQVRREVQRRPEHCFVARSAGRVVGYVTNHVQEDASRGTIANLAVEKSFRRRGIGRGLILSSLEHFRSLGLRQAKIETLSTNPAGQHLYPAVGFKEVVRQIHYVMSL